MCVCVCVCVCVCLGGMQSTQYTQRLHPQNPQTHNCTMQSSDTAGMSVRLHHSLADEFKGISHTEISLILHLAESR